MKYAIISDVHGNNLALQAVLADAKAQGADHYLFLGDYAHALPQANDAVDTIRSIGPATVIKGNGDGNFDTLIGKDFSELTTEQMKPTYWAYKSLSPQNLEYLANLPEVAAIKDGDFNIRLEHAMKLFFRSPKVEPFQSREFRTHMAREPFTHEDYLLFARAILLSTPGVLDDLHALDEGIYLFGHNHLQFHMEYEGRLFINPGSCGQPLDWDTRAPYTLLTISDGGWHVEERRVEYDVDRIISELDRCGFTEYAPFWSEILKLSTRLACDYFEPFVMHVEQTGRKMGEYRPPVSNAAWDEAVKTWDVRRTGGGR